MVNNKTAITLCEIKNKQVRSQCDIVREEKALSSNPSSSIRWFYKLRSILDIFYLSFHLTNRKFNAHLAHF